MTPTARTLRHLREAGWYAAVVESWIPRTFIRRDAFGWADVLAVHPVKGIALVQTTTGSNLAARVEKAKGIGALTAWLLAGGKLLAHGWRKLHPRGERGRWEVREVELGLEDLAGSEGQGSQDETA